MQVCNVIDNKTAAKDAHWRAGAMQASLACCVSSVGVQTAGTCSAATAALPALCPQVDLTALASVARPS